MFLSIFTAEEFGRFFAFIDWFVEDIADALCEFGYDLTPQAALQLAEDAVYERVELDASEQSVLDKRAVASEHDLTAELFPPEPGPQCPVVEATMRAACEAAVVLRSRARFSTDELVAVGIGAFLLSPEKAYDIALAVDATLPL